jgi:hypothetical protein
VPTKKRFYVPSGVHAFGRPFTPGAPYELPATLCRELQDQGVAPTEPLRAGLADVVMSFCRVYKPHEFRLQWRKPDAPGKLNEQELQKLSSLVRRIRKALHVVLEAVDEIDALVANRGTDPERRVRGESPSKFAAAADRAAVERLRRRCDKWLTWYDQAFQPRATNRPPDDRRNALRAGVDRCLRDHGIPAAVKRRTKSGLRPKYAEVRDNVTYLIEREADRLKRTQ